MTFVCTFWLSKLGILGWEGALLAIRRNSLVIDGPSIDLAGRYNQSARSAPISNHVECVYPLFDGLFGSGRKEASQGGGCGCGCGIRGLACKVSGSARYNLSFA